MTINWTTISKRISFGLSAAAAVAAAKPELLLTASGRISLAGVALAAAIPVGTAPAGILSPASPGQLSLAQQLQQAAAAIITAPADKKRVEIETIARQEALRTTQDFINKTGIFAPVELGQAAVSAALPADEGGAS